LPWYWLYDIGMGVEINENARLYFPNSVGKKGYIEELLKQGTVDYGVRLDNGELYALKENEINIIPSEVDE
jgi:hypothetical protein